MIIFYIVIAHIVFTFHVDALFKTENKDFEYISAFLSRSLIISTFWLPIVITTIIIAVVDRSISRKKK